MRRRLGRVTLSRRQRAEAVQIDGAFDDPMKRTERHHLKENEFAHIAASTREALEAKSGQIGKVGIAVAIIVLAAIGYGVWRNRIQGRAGTLLADAMAAQDARVGAPEMPGRVTVPTICRLCPAHSSRFASWLAKAQA